MKENNKQVVFYSAEKDGFLESYKDKGSLAFTAVFNDCLGKALFLPLEPYEEQKDKLDGSDFERTERNEVTRDEIKAFLRKIIN